MPIFEAESIHKGSIMSTFLSRNRRTCRIS